MNFDVTMCSLHPVREDADYLHFEQGSVFVVVCKQFDAESYV